ncbi:MAG TPA: FixH family protein [Bryobacteraceae bacterium]|nr:FixH family protein [Bryobacteraceae bacterium]
MKNVTKTLVVTCLLAFSSPAAVFAAAADYAFEPVQANVKNGSGSEIAIKLIHKPSGKPVTGAVIFRTRLDMSPDGMATMESKIEPLKEDGTGVYKFRADFTMAGRWALKLQAKVQGEADTVEGTVVFTAGQ